MLVIFKFFIHSPPPLRIALMIFPQTLY